MSERRTEHRDETMVTIPITCFITLKDGTPVEGVAKDVSDHGARIAAEIGKIHSGDEVEIVFVLLDNQKVRYVGEVRHIDPATSTFGLVFKSGPEAVTPPPQKDPYCKECDRYFAPHFKFCGNCGGALMRAGELATK